MISATPKYVADAAGDFKAAPPGHRFNLYFPIWNERTWEREDKSKAEALKKTLHVPTESCNQIEALRTRQQALVALAADDAKLSLEAEATSPLATGMGMEHPLENGFAFLNPYGLPYLPGSSIKGVLRRAAEELRDANEEGWDDAAIDALFGHQDSNNASRGALIFWDTIPELAGNTMGMDVMTPHYGDYYQGNTTPHDAGSPNPIVFMVIPPGSKFSFHVTADISRLKEVTNWKDLLQAAFEHAFLWLGFGAKTAVGYGAMKKDLQVVTNPIDKEAIKWLDSTIEKVKNENNIIVDAEAYASKPMADAWQLIGSSELKGRVLEMLKSIWEQNERPPSKKARREYGI